jgi:hypothetical protein
MEQTPLICPVCGELVIARPDLWNTLIIPPHPDRVMPQQCPASALVLKASSRTSR